MDVYFILPLEYGKEYCYSQNNSHHGKDSFKKKPPNVHSSKSRYLELKTTALSIYCKETFLKQSEPQLFT
jgi:hypothetical protein